DTSLRPSVEDGPGDRLGIVRVVYRRCASCAYVDDLVARLAQIRCQGFFQLEARVVRTDCQPHFSSLLSGSLSAVTIGRKPNFPFVVERISRSGARTTGVCWECPDKPVCHEREATKSRDQAQQEMRVWSSAFRLHWSGAC